MLADFETEVEYHRKIIEGFLNEHSSKLQLVAGTHTMEFLIQPANLRTVFDLINRGQGTISDLSVMDAQGNHRAYVGPYDLLTKNYAQEFWFKQVREKGVYISDMFLGFRKEPHFIIAVAQNGPDGPWILRATINTEAFRALVENVQIGRTGEAYLLNEEGVFQTSPRFSGEIMGRSAYPIEHLAGRHPAAHPRKRAGPARQAPAQGDRLPDLAEEPALAARRPAGVRRGAGRRQPRQHLEPHFPLRQRRSASWGRRS